MTETESLYQKLGGKPAVEAVVDDFYRRILADAALAPFFAGTDMESQRRHQVAFVSMALGAPSEYAGKAMQAAHAGRGIGEVHFNAVAGHLGDALQGAGVGSDDIATILGVIGGLKDDVVEV